MMVRTVPLGRFEVVTSSVLVIDGHERHDLMLDS
jgi:hypothetical protein